DRGRYRMYHLPPGKYRVYVFANQNPNRGLPMTGHIGSHPGLQPGLAPVYYPASPDAAHATERQLAPGAELDGIDVHLIPQRLYPIRGRIVEYGPRESKFVY